MMVEALLRSHTLVMAIHVIAHGDSSDDQLLPLPLARGIHRPLGLRISFAAWRS
jgi:hypothetical protein